MDNYSEVFQKATGLPLPFAYQCRLACGNEAGLGEPSTLRSGTTFQSQLIEIPTGLGKTAAVVLAWLWNRVLQPDVEGRKRWPRRLVYCLPMRTLVEQTHDNVETWLTNLDLEEQVGAHVLMGGEEAGEWDIYPEEDAILIGTQDMLLSRALNRGYGMSRARWPMHFGLLNNDCLWVLDETQLMGVGIPTSAQLQGLREKIGTLIGCATWWISATLDSRPLATPDYQAPTVRLNLSEDDLQIEAVHRRVYSQKHISELPCTLSSDSSKLKAPHLETLAKSVLEKHKAGTTTIVILNRVDRAQELFAILERTAKKAGMPHPLLVHSRFRPLERESLSARIKSPEEKILVATQAIEAGVDISARTLFTELAPWSSLVQRFGRCNRSGEFNDQGGAEVFWINLEAEDEKSAESLALPYLPEQLATARGLLREIDNASPEVLRGINAEEPLPEVHILRRKDLIDLFDTTPDLSGLDIDVGRYIRDGEDRDVQVFWRNLSSEDRPPEDIVPQRQELVRVPVDAFRKFSKDKREIWFWSVLDGGWQRARGEQIAPGGIYLVDLGLGGYSETRGWTGEKSKETFHALTFADQQPKHAPRDGQDEDEESESRAWQSIEAHTEKVVAACKAKLNAFPEAGPWSEALLTAALWHDFGKAHASFQRFISEGREVPEKYCSKFLAKSPIRLGARHERPHFRHELASALAWLQEGGSNDPLFMNLVAFLVATHHGKIRLSIRAMPGEIAPPASAKDEKEPLYARGIWDGDEVPADSTKKLLVKGIPTQPVKLDLGLMQIGEYKNQLSWTARMVALREEGLLGVFRLPLLETILRAADAEGSQL